MSTFTGLIEEIPGISIDYFEEENLNSSAFFLSHCHQDHMNGINNEFFSHLRKKNSFLYCSHMSKLFLESSFCESDISLLNKHVIELPLDEPKIIDYVHRKTHILLSVSCASSGHCPGSIMFLLEFNDKRILYTGDFRISKQYFPKLKSLHYNNFVRIPLNINKIYLDTTFLSLDFKTFPSRKDSLIKLCTVVDEWIRKESKNIVILEISALYGSEYIYINLSKILKTKIHVKETVFNIYSRIEILSDCVTNISESTQIHACMSKRDSYKNLYGLKCRLSVDKKNILTIVLSVQKWVGKNTSCIIEPDKIRKQTVNICYSTHASYEELEAFILYFKPKEVFACVNHKTKETQDLLKKIMEKNENNESISDTNRTTFSSYRTSENDYNFKSRLLSDDEDDI